MAYLDNILGHGEEKLYVAHRHIIFLIARVALRLLAALVLLAIGIVLKVKVQGTPGLVLLMVFLAVALVFVAQTLVLQLQWRNELYVITQHRVIQIAGVFGKHTEDSSLTMINDLILDQSIWGRMLNFGDLQIVTGNDLGDKLVGVANPFAFKRALLAAREAAANPAGYAAAPYPVVQPYAEMPPAEAPYAAANQTAQFAPQRAEDVTALIARLADLRDRGAISQQEFDAKRAELLRRI